MSLNPDVAILRRQLHGAIRRSALRDGRRLRLVSPDGLPNSWLIDLRPILTRANTLDALAEVFWHRFERDLPFQIGGMETAATPLIAAILMKSVQKGYPINGFIVRKERKTYGAGNIIEGSITDDPIIVIDDIISSGRSADKIFSVLEDNSRRFRTLFAIIDYQSPDGCDWRERRGVDVSSLFNLMDFGLKISAVKRTPRAPIFETAWRFQSPDANFHSLTPKSSPVTDETRVYFGSDIGNFYALDCATGECCWKFKISTRQHKNIWSTPALHKGRVYFGGYDGNVYCLDTETGREIWRNTDAEWVGASPAIASDLNQLFIGLEFGVEGRRGAVAALDLDSGETLWSYATRRYTHGSPAYSSRRRVVACGSNDNELLLFDARTGARLWRFETRGDTAKGSIRQAPAFWEAGGHVVTGCADGRIYVVDIASGQEVWAHQTANTINSAPLIVGDKAFIGSTDKSLYVLDLVGRTVHTRMDANAKIFSTPALIEGKVLFGATDGSVYRVDPDTIALEGVARLPDAVTNRITHAPRHGLYYALTYTNQIFALRPT